MKKLINKLVMGFKTWRCIMRASRIITDMKLKHPHCEGVMAASEISFSCGLTAAKAGAQAAGSASGNADMSGTEMIASVQAASTSEAAISIGGCDQIQAIFLRNMDEAITITVGLNNPITQVVSVIPAGKAILLWGPPSTLYFKSASGTPDLFVVACEN